MNSFIIKTKTLLSCYLVFFVGLICCVQQNETEIYLFAYFKKNGEDGLHLATSKDGKKWTALKQDQSFLSPTAGKDKLMRDPCIVQGPDGIFHMVWTVSWNEQGIGYAHSKDLVNWSEQRYLPVMEHEPTARNCWAPEIFYDDVSQQFMIYWATTIPNRFPATDTLGDDGYNHRLYYVTTKDFKSFSDTQLLYDKGFNVIDGTLIKAANKYVLFLKNETKKPIAEKNIRIATSQQLTTGYSDASPPITDNWVEGPTVIKIQDQWIVYFDRYTQKKMGAVASSDLENWIDISEELSFPDGVRHGTILKVKATKVEKVLTFQ